MARRRTSRTMGRVPFDMSMGEILVILLVALIVFGGRLPDTARKLGSAFSEFKRGLREEMRKVEEGTRRDEPPKDWHPAPGDAGSPEASAFRRWLAEFRGPARLEKDRLVVVKGARLVGSDGEKDAIVAEAARVEILLATESGTLAAKEICGSEGVRVEGRGEAARVEILLATEGGTLAAKEICGSEGVRVEGRGKTPAVVTADRLSFVAGTKEVRVSGNARVVADGWPRDVRFRDLLFVLTADGIDLRHASAVEVR